MDIDSRFFCGFPICHHLNIHPSKHITFPILGFFQQMNTYLIQNRIWSDRHCRIDTSITRWFSGEGTHQHFGSLLLQYFLLPVLKTTTSRAHCPRQTALGSRCKLWIILIPPLSKYLNGVFKEACMSIGWLVSQHFLTQGKQHLSLYTYWLEAPKLIPAQRALGASSQRLHKLLSH